MCLICNKITACNQYCYSVYNHSVILYSYSCKLFKFTLFLSLLENKEDRQDDRSDNGEADEQQMETEDKQDITGTGTIKQEEHRKDQQGGNSDLEKGLSSRM